MHRVPNPPKRPTSPASEARSHGGLRAVKSRFGSGDRARLGALLFAWYLVTGHAGFGGLVDVAAGEVTWTNVVVLGTSPSRTEIIRSYAEAIRSNAFAILLADSNPKPWVVRCAIHVHATADSFEQAVGGSPVDARGATSLEFSGDRVTTRRIDVMGDGPSVVPDALAHELIHVVLADHFVHAAPPRWADEGLALLFDSPEKQRGHEADFREAHRRGLTMSVTDLLAAQDYPVDASRQRVFYGQSAALARWLIARRDAATFIRFVDDLSDIGMEAAFDRHYGITSLASVSSAWSSDHSSDWKEVAPINTLGLSIGLSVGLSEER